MENTNPTLILDAFRTIGKFFGIRKKLVMGCIKISAIVLIIDSMIPRKEKDTTDSAKN